MEDRLVVLNKYTSLLLRERQLVAELKSVRSEVTKLKETHGFLANVDGLVRPSEHAKRKKEGRKKQKQNEQKEEQTVTSETDTVTATATSAPDTPPHPAKRPRIPRVTLDPAKRVRANKV
jgi:vacuolar-type H+-ATPase subunit I/STV1